jgi:general secretion pathway protein A
MPEATLEALRVLSNLETAKSKLLQIILVGQPELDAILGKHALRQLAQRIAVRARIERLSWRQSRAYVVHRIQCAGRPANRPLFTTPALWYLAFVARGIPRTLNIACDNALINGYGAGAKRISFGLAREACRSLQVRAPLPRLAWGAASVAVLATMIGAALINPRETIVHPASAAITATEPMSAPAAAAPASPAPVGSAPSVPPVASAPAPAAAVPMNALWENVPLPTSSPPELPKPVVRAASTGGSVARAQDPVWRWFVRKGDTLYKVCHLAYGFCDDETMRAIYAHNPNLEPDAIIRRGQVLIMPQRIESAGTN